MAFSLKALLYVFALLASCLGLFGLTGFGIWSLVLALWGKRLGFINVRWSELLTIIAVVSILIALLLPAVQSGGSRFGRTSNNAKQIALSMHIHHDATGQLPPPYTTDSNGDRLHSWRTLLWQFTEGNTSYRTLDLSKPWNDPINKPLLDPQPWHSYRFDGYDDTSRQTNLLAVVDDRTVWPPDGGISLKEVTDGLSQTIAFIEVENSGIDAMEPRDLSFDEAVDLLVGGGVEVWETSHDSWIARHIMRHTGSREERLVAFMDGYVEWLGNVDRATATAMLTRDAGDVVPSEVSNTRRYVRYTTEYARTEIRWARLWSICLFAVLVILPAFKIASRDQAITQALESTGE